MAIDVGESIRKRRTARKLTQEQLAEKVGVSTGYISHIERNERDADSELLKKIASALGVSPAAFFEDDEPERASTPEKDSIQVHFSMPGNASPEQMKRIRELAKKLAELPDDDSEMIIDVVNRILEGKK